MEGGWERGQCASSSSGSDTSAAPHLCDNDVVVYGAASDVQLRFDRAVGQQRGEPVGKDGQESGIAHLRGSRVRGTK